MTVPEKGRAMLSVDFEVEPLAMHGKELACAISGAAVNGGVIELGKGNAHTMSFELVPGNVAGLSFVAAQDNPFCSMADDCPKKGDQINQFTNVTVSADGQTLTVAADPGTDPIVHYALRFTDGQKTVTWDPIIINH
jgi:hypothetical protein